MPRLPIDHPEVHQQFMQCGFSVQLVPRIHSTASQWIKVHQTIKERDNRHTETAGGTKGFSLKRAAVEKYYLTSEYRSMYLRQLRKNGGTRMSPLSHSDLHITRDESGVQSIVKLLYND